MIRQLPKWAYEIALTACVFTIGYIVGTLKGVQATNEYYEEALAQQSMNINMDESFGDFDDWL